LRHTGLTTPRYSHPTETDDRVLSYLEGIFQARPINRDQGADLDIDGVTIEVKSCREWVKAHPKHCNGATRRRGYFQIHGTEDADYFLFVLVLADGRHRYKLLPFFQVIETFSPEITKINWLHIFELKGPPTSPAIAGRA
jgi:hypothetical protein